MANSGRRFGDFVYTMRCLQNEVVDEVDEVVDTLSDKISADKSAENMACCRKFCPPKNFVRRKFCPPKLCPFHLKLTFRRTKLPKFRVGAENFVRRKVLSAENFVRRNFVQQGMAFA